MLFLRCFALKPIERTNVLLNKSTLVGIFTTALRLRDRRVLMWQLLKILNVFNTLILKQIFWKTKISLKKLEELFLDENTKIENATFLRKTSPSEDNMKANWMGSTKWNYHKERSFPSNYFIFLNFFFSLKSPYKEFIWCSNYADVQIYTFRNRWRFIWGQGIQ